MASAREPADSKREPICLRSCRACNMVTIITRRFLGENEGLGGEKRRRRGGRKRKRDKPKNRGREGGGDGRQKKETTQKTGGREGGREDGGKVSIEST